MEWLSDPQAWASLLTLTALEVVLGIDNIIFISILAGRLPEHQRQKARNIGLLLAMGTRILLLISIAWVIGLTGTLFTVFDHEVSGRDIILFGGGLFLLAKSTHEIHASFEDHHETDKPKATSGFLITIIQIGLLDIIFSLDSVITAVGMAEHLPVMILAIVLAVMIMMFASGPVGDFVDRNPTLKMLALSFLILIGVSLIADGLSFHIPKGYIYFAMAFSLGVELLNMKLRKQLNK
ncbi:TerC family protein [Sansalvadorimonas sp. 2012CJ34-2]|uniref:TerC family protein n=1 Tax=Parendozoicomonas callyspongiae TaxID=2942213 RepID=A0ABT0PIE3_9GAMM|nr:TerC family protein [Sansalvadorimonas sp. 2012CJ34-2]MCL6271124.1 TerC family protein [Sansalvadorimonas sp. 2012CJ34-2]